MKGKAIRNMGRRVSTTYLIFALESLPFVVFISHGDCFPSYMSHGYCDGFAVPGMYCQGQCAIYLSEIFANHLPAILLQSSGYCLPLILHTCAILREEGSISI